MICVGKFGIGDVMSSGFKIHCEFTTKLYREGPVSFGADNQNRDINAAQSIDVIELFILSW